VLFDDREEEVAIIDEDEVTKPLEIGYRVLAVAPHNVQTYNIMSKLLEFHGEYASSVMIGTIGQRLEELNIKISDGVEARLNPRK